MSEQDIASLGLKVDSSQVKEADKSLDSFAKSAHKAESASADVGKASAKAAEQFDKSSKRIITAAAHIAEIDPRLRTAAHALDHLGFSAGSLLGLGAAAAAIIGLTKAAFEGARESENLARSILVTGNAAGVTSGQLAVMAQRMAAISGTQHDAAESLAAFTATGKVASQNLERFAGIAAELQEKVGVPVAETAKQFAALADEPAKAAQELQKQFNFLTPAVYRYIKAQQDAGNVSAAAAAAQGALAGALERQLHTFDESSGLIIKSWNAIKGAASAAWDAMLGIGRTESPETRLANIQEQLKRASSAGRFGNDLFTSGQSRAALEEQAAALQKQVDQRSKEAAALGDLKKRTDAYTDSQNAATNAAEEFEQAQDAINKAWMAFDAAKAQHSLEKVVAAFDAANDELEARKQANLVTDEQFFAQKRALLKRETDAEIAALREANKALGNQDGLSSVERIAAQGKIAENEAKIAALRIKFTGQLRVADLQEADALKKKADALADAQDSADKYTQSLIRQYQIEVQGLGLGEKEKQRLKDIQDIESRFLDRRDELTADKRRGDITEAQYRQYLKIEQNALEKSLKAYDDYYKELQQKQGSWLVGVQEGLANWLDSARDVSGQVADLIENSMDRGIDAVVEFARTGKLNFGKLVEDILADLLRIELRVLASQALQQIFGALGSAAGGGTAFQNAPSNTPGDGGFVGPPRAEGGPVRRGFSQLVGEKGAEKFIAPTDGYIVPNGGMGPTVNVNSVINMPQGVTPAELNAVLDVRDGKIKYDITENMLRGRGAWAR